MKLFAFPDDIKWCHFAFAADPESVRSLRSALEQPEATREAALEAFVDARRAAFVSRWAGLPREQLAESEEVADAPPSHPWLVARVAGLVERMRTLKQIGYVPDEILERSREALRSAVEQMRAFADGDEQVLGANLGPFLRDALACCVQGENVGLQGWFELTSPVARVFEGQSPWSHTPLHPPEPLVEGGGLELYDDDVGPVFLATGAALVAWAEELAAGSAVLGPSREALEHTGDPNHLRFVDAAGAEVQRQHAAGLEAERQRYAAAARRAGASGLSLLSWIGKNPAL